MRIILCIYTLLTLALLAGVASSQELPSSFYRLQSGDIGALGGPVGLGSVPVVNRQRTVYQLAFDEPSSRTFVGQGSRALLVQGEPVGATGLLSCGSSLFACLSAGGTYWATSCVTDGANYFDTALYRGGRPVIVPGQVCTAPSLPPGSRYLAPVTAGLAGGFDDRCYIGALLDVGAIQFAIVEVVTDPSGFITSERIVARPGQSIPGLQGSINNVLGGAVHENGASFLQVVENPSASGPGGLVAVFNGVTAIRLGDPSPYPGRSWADLGAGAVGSNGDWAMAGVLDDGKRVIIRNGQPFQHEDDLPEELGTATTPVRFMEPVAISSRGRVTWRVVMDSQTPVTSGYFVESRPFMITERTEVDGVPAAGGLLPWSVDEDGVNVGMSLGYGDLSTGIVRIGAAFPLDQSDPYCSNGETSSGTTPIVTVHGSPWLADDTDFEIMTRRLPAGVAAISLASDAPGSVQDPAGSIGELCLGGTVRRSPVLQASSTGTTRAWLSEFAGLGAQPPNVGETWHFQAWYRDSDPGGPSAVSRWTEAVSLTFL